MLDYLWQSAATFDVLADLTASSAHHPHGDASESAARHSSLQRSGWWHDLVGEQGSLRRRHSKAGAEGPGSLA